MVRQRQLVWIQGSKQLIACPTRQIKQGAIKKYKARCDKGKVRKGMKR